MKLPIVRWAAKPSTRPITADEARMPAGEGANLRDHEQRREDADEDDRPEDRAAEDPVAGRSPRAGACARAIRQSTIFAITSRRRSPRPRSRPAARSRASVTRRPSRSACGPRSRPRRRARSRPRPRRGCQQRRTVARRPAARESRAGRCRRPCTGTPSSSSSLEAALKLGGKACELRSARLRSPTASLLPLPAIAARPRAGRPRAPQPRAYRDHPLGQRPHPGEGAVSLGGSERASATAPPHLRRRSGGGSRSGSRSSLVLIALGVRRDEPRRRKPSPQRPLQVLDGASAAVI